jgi:electron-transferring-flavoprotein dehydrogenase
MNMKPTSYSEQVKTSWLWDELYRVRNVRPAFRFGLWAALLFNAVDTFVFKGRARGRWPIAMPITRR